jgi:hypothetical protein
MSTPSANSFNPFDLSPYAPKRAREHPAPERPLPEKDEAAAALLSFAPPGATPVATAPDAVRSETYPQGASRLDSAEARSADLDAGDKVQPAPATSATPERPAAERRADSTAPRDLDLDRLESSLQWLRQAGEAGHLPRARPLPAVPGLRPYSQEGGRAREDQFINGIRVPHSLAPDRLRPPPPLRERRSHLRWPLRVVLASVLAAPIAYYVSVGNLSLLSEPAGQAELATRMVTSAEFPIPKDELRPSETDEYNSMMAARNRVLPQQTAMTESAPTPRAESALPKVPDAPALAMTQPAGEPLRELDPEAIKHLMQQGEQFVAAGDLATARLVFRRAAEAGDAAAALAMGDTFDPTVLARMGVRGMGADVEKARSWYEKAKSFGSPDAPRRLEMLANR